MNRLVFLTLLLLPCAVHAQKVTLPTTLTREVKEWILIPCEVDGGPPKWELSPGLEEPPLWNVFPPDVLKTMKGKVVVAKQPGTYTVKAWNAKADAVSDISVCTIFVGVSPPAPPGPTPPGPTPPTPPAPQSPLAKTLQAAYDTDTEPDKGRLLVAFRDVITAVPKQIAAARTNAQLAAAVKAVTDAEVGAGKLSKTRAAVGKHLNDTLPPGEVEFTEATRATFAVAYSEVAKALGEVRP